MLSNTTCQTQLQNILSDMVTAETLPAGMKIDVYSGQIDIIKLSVDAGKFPAILINWQGDSDLDKLNYEPDEFINFTLLICTDSAAGLTEGMGIVDTLNENLLGEWNNDDGDFMFNLFKGKVKPVFNLKRKQVIAYPVRLEQ
jgi:hypothetical protein